MGRKKGVMTVTNAVKKVFDSSSDVFYSYIFCAKVRAEVGRAALMDGTTLRRLRDLRISNTDYNYKVIDQDKGQYKKIKHGD